jgi:hypothetical protein
MLAPKKDHKIDLNVQNMEINDLNEKVTALLTEFNKFRDHHHQKRRWDWEEVR